MGHEILGAIGANLGAIGAAMFIDRLALLAPSGTIGAKIGAWIGANSANLGANEPWRHWRSWRQAAPLAPSGAIGAKIGAWIGANLGAKSAKI